MTKLEILQKEAREKFNNNWPDLYQKIRTNPPYTPYSKCNRAVTYFVDDLISSVYRSAIEDAKGVVEAIIVPKSAQMRQLVKRQAITALEALKNLDELMPGV